jgi:membrane-bound lytic murein transglycosylase D
MKLLTALFFAAALPVAAQKVEVPHKLDFAGITLIIRDDARREIQRDVDALTASPRHYQIKAERAKTYFPIIEKVFREEGLPDDFKYLVLQESALIPDAVSTSNAVGFWQFKDFTAIEMGLRVDREIDERLNIVSSTRAAARYIIKNNQFFSNWLYALQSYQMGAGGVMKSVENTEANATRMDITGKTYWYVKKFLAHKIAYEGGVRGVPKKTVVVFENRGRNTLSRLAKDIPVEEEALKDLNRWTKSGIIPDDRTYAVLLPVEGTSVSDASISTLAGYGPKIADPDAAPISEVRRLPEATASVVKRTSSGKINGLHTIEALPGDDARRLAARAGIELPKLLRWNDLKIHDPIIPGQLYFLAKKRVKGSEAFHKVSAGETLWSISQRYGIQIRRLKRYNRMREEASLAEGTMLYLASKRPRENHAIATVEDAVEVSNEETFNWSVKTEASGEEIKDVPEKQVQQVANETIVYNVPKDVDSLKILQTNKTTPTLEDKGAVTPPPLPASLQHTVKAGETLYGIAKLYNLAVMDLVTLNDLTLQQGIKPGQVLKLSSGEQSIADIPGKDDQRKSLHEELYHVVKISDTLYSIARQYNVTIKQIMEWNEKKDFSLAVGEKLRIMRAP